MFALRPQPFFQYVPTEGLSYQSRVPTKRTSAYQLATPAPAKQPLTKSKSDAAKERYIRALAEQKAARKAYADALAEEELRKMEAQLDAPKPVEEDPATQLLRALGLSVADRNESDLFAVSQEQRRRRVLEEQRRLLEEQHRRAEEERRCAVEEQARQEQLRARRAAEEQIRARRAAEEEARLRRAAEEQARARRAAEEQRRAALEAQQSRQREFARAQAMAYAQALRAALDAEEAERIQQQASYRNLGGVTTGPSKTAVPAAAEPSKKKTVSFSVPVATANTPAASIPITTITTDKKGKRSTSLPPLPTNPLAAIAHLERAFDAKRTSFALPPALDFGAQGGLTFTPRNAPVHAYEHALGRLLTQLDAVESDGEESIRRERKRVVKRVEGELEGVEGQVKALWEAEHPAAVAPAVEDTHVEAAAAEAALVEAAVVAADEVPITLDEVATEVAQAAGAASLPDEFVEVAAPVFAEEREPATSTTQLTTISQATDEAPQDVATEETLTSDAAPPLNELVEPAAPPAVTEEHGPVDDATSADDVVPVSLKVAAVHESQHTPVSGFVVDEPVAVEVAEEQLQPVEATAASTTLTPAVGISAAPAVVEDPAVSTDSEDEVSSVSDASEHSEEDEYELVY